MEQRIDLLLVFDKIHSPLQRQRQVCLLIIASFSTSLISVILSYSTAHYLSQCLLALELTCRNLRSVNWLKNADTLINGYSGSRNALFLSPRTPVSSASSH